MNIRMTEEALYDREGSYRSQIPLERVGRPEEVDLSASQIASAQREWTLPSIPEYPGFGGLDPTSLGVNL